MTKNKPPYKGLKRYGDCDLQERKAIHTYIKGAHPSNIPDDITEAWWNFTKESVGIRAGLFRGFL